MRCATCGTEIYGRPSNCPHCGAPLWYEPGAAQQSQAQTQQTAPTPQGPWQGAQQPYPGYGGYPQEEQAPPPGYGPMYPQQMPPGAPYGAAAPPSTPYGYGAYAPPSMPYGYGAYAPPSMPPGPGIPPGYQMPYPPGYGPGQPYLPYGFGAPATTPFAPAPSARKRRTNPLVVVLSIVCALVVIAAAGVGAVYLTQHPGSFGPTTGTLASATNTPSLTVIYQNTMTTPDSGWPQDQHCFFRSDGYHIVDGELCFAPIDDLVNVDIKVNMTVLSGDFGAPHGIALRHDSSHDYYFFGVDPYGHWAFFSCLSSQSACTRVVDFRANSAIHGGLNAVNTLEVTALGSHFTFKVNDTEVGTADDTSLTTTGGVGLAGQDNSEVVFSNVTITLPQR